MNDTFLLFDLDGTLWDSAESVAASWNEALEGKGFPVLTADDSRSVMGKNMQEIAEMLFGAYSEEERMALLSACVTHENEYIAKHGGVLMDGCRETMAELKRRGYALGIVSNCQTGYIDAFLDSMKMREYFTDYQEWGATHLPKGENIRIIHSRHPEIAKAVYIGDTQGDCDAADLAGVPFYHAAYGFGKVTHTERELHSVGELLEIFR